MSMLGLQSGLNFEPEREMKCFAEILMTVRGGVESPALMKVGKFGVSWAGGMRVEPLKAYS